MEEDRLCCLSAQLPVCMRVSGVDTSTNTPLQQTDPMIQRRAGRAMQSSKESCVNFAHRAYPESILFNSDRQSFCPDAQAWTSPDAPDESISDQIKSVNSMYTFPLNKYNHHQLLLGSIQMLVGVLSPVNHKGLYQG